MDPRTKLGRAGMSIVIVTILGSGLVQAMTAVAIVSIPVYARVMRASVLSVRELDYVTAARALGDQVPWPPQYIGAQRRQ